MRLVSVYDVPDAEDILYVLLEQRTPEQSISHRKMPTLPEHRAFIKSKPYLAWYLIEEGAQYVGATYLSQQREIGIFIFNAHQGRGLGRRAVEMLMRGHPGEFLANVNPNNANSRRFWEKLGGRLIQVTYRLNASST
jgi:RimJ/RimL family protein N-acetyltransferase